MSSNGNASVEEGMESNGGYEIIGEEECEEFFDCVEEQSQEAKILHIM